MWNKPLDNENLGSSENRNPNVQKERKPGISSTIMEQLNKSVDLTQEYCPQFDVTEYLAFLDVIEQVDFSTASFGGKHVLGIEGLQFSGKSTLIDQITSRYANIEVIKRRKVPEIITNHSLTAQIAWDCLENYRIAKLIIDSSSDVILIEDYYHNFLAKYISVKVASENDLVNLPYTTFSWPHDLPMPELVLFLTSPTSQRLGRRPPHIDKSLQTPELHEAQDIKANSVYACVRGPGTVGIDTSCDAVTVCNTVIEALDYFGFYSISRASSAHTTEISEPQQVQLPSFAEEEPIMPAEVITNRRLSMGVYSMYSHF